MYAASCGEGKGAPQVGMCFFMTNTGCKIMKISDQIIIENNIKM